MPDGEEEETMYSGVRPHERVLKNQAYASGDGWYRATLEKIVSVLVGTRLRSADIEFLLRMGGGGRVYIPARVRFIEKGEPDREETRWLLTPILFRIDQQTPRGPTNEIPNRLLEEKLREEIGLQQTNPDDPVEYLYQGTSIDEKLVSYIRSKAFLTEEEWRSHWQDDPPPTWLEERDGKFFIPRREENLAGQTLRAHYRAHEEVIMMKDVITHLYKVQEDFGYQEKLEELLSQLRPLASEEQNSRIKAAIEGLGFTGTLRLLEEFKRRISILAIENPLLAATHEKKLRDLDEEILEKGYDRTLPGEQYKIRALLSDLAAVYASDWESKAQRIWNIMSLVVHVEAQPEVIALWTGSKRDGEVERLTKDENSYFTEEAYVFRSGGWTYFIRWDKAVIHVAPIENLRDLQRMVDHWKMTKAAGNSLDSNKTDMKGTTTFRLNDHGGIWNPIQYKYDWRFMKLYNWIQNGDNLDEKRALLGDQWFEERVARISRVQGIPVDQVPAPTDEEVVEAAKLVLMGPVWSEKVPEQLMLHDGVLWEEFLDARAGFTYGINIFRELAPAAADGTFPRKKDLFERYHRGLRNYLTELAWLLRLEAMKRDSKDIIDNQGGLFKKSQLDVINIRLKSAYPSVQAIRLDYFNATRQGDFLLAMWQLAPADRTAYHVEALIADLKIRNVLHFRPEIDKYLDGAHRSTALKEYTDRWYEDSDNRIWDFLYWINEAGSDLDKVSGAEGFSIEAAVKLNQESFGLGYGSLCLQQERQERLQELGLKAKYYSTMKGILEWWSVRKSAVRLRVDVDEFGVSPDRSWWDINELKLKIASHLENRSLVYALAKNVLWPNLKEKKLIGKEEDFPFVDPRAGEMDWAYVREELNLLVGNEPVPTVSEAAEDPVKQEKLDAVVDRNQRRLVRVQEGRFFEINQ